MTAHARVSKWPERKGVLLTEEVAECGEALGTVQVGPGVFKVQHCVLDVKHKGPCKGYATPDETLHADGQERRGEQAPHQYRPASRHGGSK